MIRDLERVLIGRDEIAAKVSEMAGRLAGDLSDALRAEGIDEVAAESGEHFVFIPVMTGAMIFAADLIRQLPLKLGLELVAVTSYPGQTTESRGAQLASALPEGLTGKHVVIIDDIIDSGHTLALLRGLVDEREPASVRTVVLLDKAERREASISADYVGFEIPDEFVVGYGLDYDGYYRNHPDIATLKPEVIAGAGVEADGEAGGRAEKGDVGSA